MIDSNGNIIVGLLSLGWQWPSILTYTPDGTYTDSGTGCRPWWRWRSDQTTSSMGRS